MVSFMIIQAQILFSNPSMRLVYLAQFLNDQLELLIKVFKGNLKFRLL